MQRMLLATMSVLGLCSFCPQVSAQTNGVSAAATSDLELLPSDGSATPEMWFYAQEYRRYMSPREAVRRKAEFRSAQRRHRLAAQRWFGFTNLRPPANPIPHMGSYSPAWAGSPLDGYAWVGQGTPYVIYHSARRSP